MSDKKNPPKSNTPVSSALHDALIEHEDTDLSEETQKKIGKTLIDKGALSEEHKNYFGKIIKLIEEKDIDVTKPESILNTAVYEKLSEQQQGKIDIAYPNICRLLEQIKQIWDKDHEESYQMKNLVESVWQAKEKIEKECGDVYKV